MTVPQKKELASKRLKRGHEAGKKDSKVIKPKGKGDKRDVIRNLKAVNRQVAHLTKQIGKTGVSDNAIAESTHSAASTDVDDGKTGRNRNNPSLTRQQKEVQISETKK